MSLSRLIACAVVWRALVMLAGLVFVGLLLGLMWLAHKLGHMEGERWEQYFRTISTAGLLARMVLVMAAALGTVAALSVPLFAHLGFGEPVKLAALFFAAGGAHLLTRFSRRREELVAKLLKFKR